MRVVKAGRICEPVYRGTCIRCGCVVECDLDEVNNKGATVRCPTVGCNGKIQLHLTYLPFVGNDDSDPRWPKPRYPYEPRWMAGIIFKKKEPNLLALSKSASRVW